MITPVAIDFETSSINPWGDVMGEPLAAPIQIGIYVPSANLRISELIGGWDWNKYEWNETSESIHKIPKESIDAAEAVWKVDIRIAAKLLNVVGSRMFTVPLGWNVMGFDSQFLRRYFPNTNRLLSYRGIDLNTCIFQIVDSEKEYEDMKRAAKNYAKEVLEGDGTETRWHDALYDAEASWHAFLFLVNQARGNHAGTV